jgi:hypothetical protein
MLDNSLLPAIRASLRMHEIGAKSPYRLAFAGKGKSGASFGFMQGDLAAGQQEVKATFVAVLTRAGADAARIEQLLAKLSGHLIGNPLSPADAAFVDGALDKARDLVDAMDDMILKAVIDDLDRCIADAQASGRKMTGRALLYAALWINMSGHPDRLRAWLSGKDPHLAQPVAQAPALVRGLDLRGYLMATAYYTQNPGNAAHLDESVQAGATLLTIDQMAA